VLDLRVEGGRRETENRKERNGTFGVERGQLKYE